jgi:hypothetical protein
MEHSSVVEGSTGNTVWVDWDAKTEVQRPL